MEENLMQKLLCDLWSIVILLFIPSPSLFAYESGPVNGGGSISVAVKFNGPVPTPVKLDVLKDREICGQTPKLDASLIVSNGNVANAVVYISDIKMGKKVEPGKVTFDQKGCEYQPHVLAFPVGSTVEILNPDGILHNIHSYSKVNAAFNMAQPKFKKS